jgi:hypothetical protein
MDFIYWDLLDDEDIEDDPYAKQKKVERKINGCGTIHMEEAYQYNILLAGR